MTEEIKVEPSSPCPEQFGNSFADDLDMDSSTWTSYANSGIAGGVPEGATTDSKDLTSEEKETYKLFVRNLPPGILSSELLKLFQPYGKVIECEVFVKNYAFVHMESKECGLKAIAGLDNMNIKGVSINVQEARNKTIKIKHPIGSYGHQKVTTFKLFISHLPPQSNKESITNILQEFGRVVEVQILSPISAFVHIENEESGKQAISGLHGKVIDGNDKPLIVAESNEPGGPNVPVMKLLITNVSEKISAAQLRDLFNKYGMVIESKITPSANNEDRKAVVHLEALGDIRSALKEMNGYVLDDLTIKVEPILETDSKNLEGSLKYKALDPGYGKGVRPPPLIPQKDKFRPRNPGIRPLFGDNQKQWRLIPMPSAYEEQHPPFMYDSYRKPMHLVPPPSRKGIGGMGRFPSELVVRDRDNYEFYTDNYDECYETPFQPLNDESVGNEWDSWNQSYHPMETQMVDQDYSPLIKKAKPRFGQLQPQPRPLMDLPFEDGPMAHPQNNFGNSFASFRRSAPLNLPLGEKTYFSKYKKDNRNTNKPPSAPSNASIPSLLGTTPPNNRLDQTFDSQQFQQNSKSYDSSFSQDSYVLPGFYANDQIQGPNSNYWTPPTATEADKPSSSMLKNNFSFSNMANNYNANKHLQKPAAQSSFFNTQSNFLQQNQSMPSSSEYPTLKPGAKVYVNGKGKVMVRGNRGGKRRKPVMAVEMPSRATAKPERFMRGPKGKPFSKQKQDQQKMEYATWLEQKPWLHQAIPGTIKRL